MSQFVWELVRNNNAFKVKGFAGEDFTKDPSSLTGRNNFTGLGFVHNTSVAVTAGAKRNSFNVALRKRQRFPTKTVAPAKPGDKKSTRQAAGNFFRTAFTASHGVHRVSRIVRSVFRRSKGLTALALRKLYYVNKAAARTLANRPKTANK